MTTANILIALPLLLGTLFFVIFGSFTDCGTEKRSGERHC